MEITRQEHIGCPQHSQHCHHPTEPGQHLPQAPHRSLTRANPLCCCYCGCCHRSDLCCPRPSAPCCCLAPCPLSCATQPAAVHKLVLLVCNQHRSRHELTPHVATTVALAIGWITAASPCPNPANLFRGLFNPRRLRHRFTAMCQGGYVEYMFIAM